MGSRARPAIPLLVVALGGFFNSASAEEPVDLPQLSTDVVNTDSKLRVAAIAEPKAMPRAPMVEPTSEERAKIKSLLTELDSDDFATREAATTALAAMGLSAESTLRDIYRKPPSEEVRDRVERLLSSIEALHCDFTGEWEESKEHISYKCYYRIGISPSGQLTMRVTEYNRDQQYLFDSIEVKDGELCLHETFNPGYEFDVRLKPVSKDKLVGTAIRRSDNLVLKVEYNRVTQPPENP